MIIELSYRDEISLDKCQGNPAQVFSFFHIVIRAKAAIKPKYPITKGRLYDFIRHFCKLQKTEVLGVKAFGNDVHLVVKLNCNVAIGTFITFLRQWTSYWITGLNPRQCLFWKDSFGLRSLSPEDKTAVVKLLDGETLDALPNVSYFDNIDDPKTKSANCYHIILVSANCRLIIPTKFRLQLYAAIGEICTEMGATMISTASCRSHIHLLCYVPLSYAITTFFDELSVKVINWMHSNIHFRRVIGLSNEFIAFTVSEQGLNYEEYIVAHQDKIHAKWPDLSQPKCEEHLLYDRLGHSTSLKLK